MDGPIQQAFNYSSILASKGGFDNRDKLAASVDFTFERFIEMTKAFLQNGFVEWFGMGNMTRDQMLEIATEGTKALNLNKIDLNTLRKVQPLHLEDQTINRFKIPVVDTNQTNSALVEMYEYGHVTSEDGVEERLVQDIVFQVLDEPAFDTLRTKEQLGYIAYCRAHNSRDILGGIFLVQSSVKDPEFVVHRTRAFLTDVAKPLFDSMTNESLSTAIKAVKVKKEEVDMSLKKRFNRLSAEITNHRYRFDIKETQIQLLDQWLNSEDK